MSLVETEHVLVVPTPIFHELGHFQGFSADVDRYMAELFNPEHLSYRPRSEMETNPSFKQLIPYVVFRHTDKSGSQTVFAYTRGKGQGESRLHSKRSLGVGGHISSVDATDMHPYEEGMRRELTEEVDIRTDYSGKCVGLINDDQTDVGRVHLGIVHLIDVEQPDIHPRESEIIQAGFYDVGSLRDDIDSFETWSQICLNTLFF